MFRTCFRLVSPGDEDEPERGDLAPAEEDAQVSLVQLDPETGRIVDPDTWSVEFLLQHKEDPSVLVPAADVWAHSERLEALGRVLENPQERLLGGLGHALRLWPDLAPALEQAAPTALALTAEQAYGFLREAVPLLEQAGFGVITPPWWRQRLQVKLSAQPMQEWGEGTGLFGVDGLCAYEWKVAIGEETLTLAELEALAELKLPLVKARGRWIALRADDVETALRFFKGRRAKGRASAAELLREGLGVQTGHTDEELPEIEIEAAAGSASCCRRMVTAGCTRFRRRRRSSGSYAHTSSAVSHGCRSCRASGWGRVWPTTWGSARRFSCSPSCSPSANRAGVRGPRS